MIFVMCAVTTAVCAVLSLILLAIGTYANVNAAGVQVHVVDRSKHVEIYKGSSICTPEDGRMPDRSLRESPLFAEHVN